MKPRLLLLPVGIAIAAGGIAIGVLGPRWLNSRTEAGPGGSASILRPDPGWEDVRFPDFSVIDQDGRPLDQTILDGRVTIVDFIFTSCPLQCPAMTGALWQLSDELTDTSARFLSMSIDPERDTPARLKAYAADYAIDTARWPFVTGDKDAIRGIVRDALMFEVSDSEDSQVTLPDGSKMANIVHPPHFVLVGPQRQVLGIFYYQDAKQLARLKERVRKISAAIR